ncbi:serine hydrolase [Alteromonas sediminis]|nr:serine hydrolase [Alteromonas sediminis]
MKRFMTGGFLSRYLTRYMLFTIFMVAVLPMMAKAEDIYSALNDDIARYAHSLGIDAVAIEVVDSQGSVWSYGLGEVHTSNKLVDRNTPFRVGSVTKLFTDIALMQLVEKGVVDLAKPVNHYLPTFAPVNPYGVEITVEMLLTHRSGLVREPPIGNYFDSEEASLDQVIASINRTTLVYAPGSKVQYSNAALAVVGRIVEVMNNMPFDSVIQQQLMHPLNMQNSYMSIVDVDLSTMPKGYMRPYHTERFPAPTFDLGISPAGNMVSTMQDLGKLATALINQGKAEKGRILQAKTLTTMWTPVDEHASARDYVFGLGFILSSINGELAVSHGGAVYGFATQFLILPGSELGVAVSANVDFGNGAVNRIAEHVLSYILALRQGKPSVLFQHSIEINKEVANSMVGTYASKDSRITVRKKNNDIYIEWLGGLSLRLMDSVDGIVIDDPVKFSTDVQFDNESVTVFGTEFKRIIDTKPETANPGYTRFIGEYGDDHNLLYVLEKDNQLHVIIEWLAHYPLEQVGENTFVFPEYGLYPGEQLTFSAATTEQLSSFVDLGEIRFTRRLAQQTLTSPALSSKKKDVYSTLFETAKASSLPKHFNTQVEGNAALDLVNLATLSDTIAIDIKYATTDNVFGFQVYSSANAYLHKDAAKALLSVHKRLSKHGLGLIVFDAYRPWYVTQFFWAITPEMQRKFVANPEKGSPHNRAGAVDVSLYDLATGETVTMVSAYDEMTERSYPYYPGGTSIQRWYRDLLITEMALAGFNVHKNEWWHFDYKQWEQFPLMNTSFENLQLSE